MGYQGYGVQEGQFDFTYVQEVTLSTQNRRKRKHVPKEKPAG